MRIALHLLLNILLLLCQLLLVVLHPAAGDGLLTGFGGLRPEFSLHYLLWGHALARRHDLESILVVGQVGCLLLLLGLAK